MTPLQLLKRAYHVLDHFLTVLFLYLIPEIAYIYGKYYLYDFEINPEVAKQIGVLCAVVMVLSFYSGVRHITVHNAPLRETLFSLEKRPKTLTQRLKFFLTQPGLWVGTAVFALLHFAFPVGSYAMHLLDLIPGAAQDPTARFWFPALLLPILFVISLKARLTAMDRWLATEDQPASAESKKKKLLNESDREMARMTAIYFGGSLVLCNVLPLLISMLPLLQELLFAPFTIFVIVCLLIVPRIWRPIRAILKRRSFLQKLKETCRQKEIPLSDIDRPYRSIFQTTDHESFVLTVSGKRYACRLIGAVRRNAPMVLRSGGRGSFLHPFRFARITFFTRVTRFDFSFESEDQKILIVNPVPKQIYRSENGKKALLDNGDVVDGYKVYTASGFLGALDRGSIDR
ncbi:MAG: hypothetical protein IJW62_05545 [Clostridia bacterium]|nr:hypothetical protein [Clostridia bacterium]